MVYGEADNNDIKRSEDDEISDCKEGGVWGGILAVATSSALERSWPTCHARKLDL